MMLHINKGNFSANYEWNTFHHFVIQQFQKYTFQKVFLCTFETIMIAFNQILLVIALKV